MMAVFAYIGFHLWHVHFLHGMNPMNEPVPVPVAANPAAAIPNAVNAGLARGGIVVGNIATEVFQYAVPGLFVMVNCLFYQTECITLILRAGPHQGWL